MHSADTAQAPGGAGDTQRWRRPFALMAADVMVSVFTGYSCFGM